MVAELGGATDMADLAARVKEVVVRRGGGGDGSDSVVPKEI